MLPGLLLEPGHLCPVSFFRAPRNTCPWALHVLCRMHAATTWGRFLLDNLKMGREGAPVPFQLAKGVLDQGMDTAKAPVKVHLVGVQLPGV